MSESSEHADNFADFGPEQVLAFAERLALRDGGLNLETTDYYDQARTVIDAAWAFADAWADVSAERELKRTRSERAKERRAAAKTPKAGAT